MQLAYCVGVLADVFSKKYTLADVQVHATRVTCAFGPEIFASATTVPRGAHRCWQPSNAGQRDMGAGAFVVGLHHSAFMRWAVAMSSNECRQVPAVMYRDRSLAIQTSHHHRQRFRPSSVGKLEGIDRAAAVVRLLKTNLV